MIITDRVRSTREGYVLTRVCPSIRPSVHKGRGGVPQPGPDRGVPQLGVPPGQGWGTSQQGGTSLARMGYPPPAGVPPPLPASTGQHMEYLIRRGRYAFCVHAGGLCYYITSLNNTYVQVGDF